MMNNWKHIVPWAALVCLGVCAVLSFWPQKEGPLTDKPKTPRVKVTKKHNIPRKKLRAKDDARLVANSSKESEKKPSFEIDDDDEAALNAEQRKLIQAIRDALDAEDKKEVLKLVQRLQTSKEWPDGIPKSIKMAAIEALGWFGASCLPELAGFLADSDEEVVEAAVEKYEDALDDPDLSDRERSVILIQAAKVVNDSDAMDAMLSALDDMRNSVAVETIKALMASGNQTTKSLLADAIEDVTGEENIDTPEKLDAWLKENPDDEDDEEFYGGSKDNEDDDEKDEKED